MLKSIAIVWLLNEANAPTYMIVFMSIVLGLEVIGSLINLLKD